MSKSPACSLLMLALSALSTAHSLASTEGAIRTCGRTSRARLARLPPVLPPGRLRLFTKWPRPQVYERVSAKYGDEVRATAMSVVAVKKEGDSNGSPAVSPNAGVRAVPCRFSTRVFFYYVGVINICSGSKQFLLQTQMLVKLLLLLLRLFLPP